MLSIKYLFLRYGIIKKKRKKRQKGALRFKNYFSQFNRKFIQCMHVYSLYTRGCSILGIQVTEKISNYASGVFLNNASREYKLWQNNIFAQRQCMNYLKFES